MNPGLWLLIVLMLCSQSVSTMTSINDRTFAGIGEVVVGHNDTQFELKRTTFTSDHGLVLNLTAMLHQAARVARSSAPTELQLSVLVEDCIFGAGSYLWISLDLDRTLSFPTPLPVTLSVNIRRNTLGGSLVFQPLRFNTTAFPSTNLGTPTNPFAPHVVVEGNSWIVTRGIKPQSASGKTGYSTFDNGNLAVSMIFSQVDVALASGVAVGAAIDRYFVPTAPFIHMKDCTFTSSSFGLTTIQSFRLTGVRSSIVIEGATMTSNANGFDFNTDVVLLDGARFALHNSSLLVQSEVGFKFEQGMLVQGRDSAFLLSNSTVSVSGTSSIWGFYAAKRVHVLDGATIALVGTSLSVVAHSVVFGFDFREIRIENDSLFALLDKGSALSVVGTQTKFLSLNTDVFGVRFTLITPSWVINRSQLLVRDSSITVRAAGAVLFGWSSFSQWYITEESSIDMTGVKMNFQAVNGNSVYGVHYRGELVISNNSHVSISRSEINTTSALDVAYSLLFESGYRISNRSALRIISVVSVTTCQYSCEGFRILDPNPVPIRLHSQLIVVNSTIHVVPTGTNILLQALATVVSFPSGVLLADSSTFRFDGNNVRARSNGANVFGFQILRQLSLDSQSTASISHNTVDIQSGQISRGIQFLSIDVQNLSLIEIIGNWVSTVVVTLDASYTVHFLGAMSFRNMSHLVFQGNTLSSVAVYSVAALKVDVGLEVANGSTVSFVQNSFSVVATQFHLLTQISDAIGLTFRRMDVSNNSSFSMRNSQIVVTCPQKSAYGINVGLATSVEGGSSFEIRDMRVTLRGGSIAYAVAMNGLRISRNSRATVAGIEANVTADDNLRCFSMPSTLEIDEGSSVSFSDLKFSAIGGNTIHGLFVIESNVFNHSRLLYEDIVITTKASGYATGLVTKSFAIVFDHLPIRVYNHSDFVLKRATLKTFAAQDYGGSITTASVDVQGSSSFKLENVDTVDSGRNYIYAWSAKGNIKAQDDSRIDISRLTARATATTFARGISGHSLTATLGSHILLNQLNFTIVTYQSIPYAMSMQFGVKVEQGSSLVIQASSFRVTGQAANNFGNVDAIAIFLGGEVTVNSNSVLEIVSNDAELSCVGSYCRSLVLANIKVVDDGTMLIADNRFVQGSAHDLVVGVYFTAGNDIINASAISVRGNTVVCSGRSSVYGIFNDRIFFVHDASALCISENNLTLRSTDVHTRGLHLDGVSAINGSSVEIDANNVTTHGSKTVTGMMFAYTSLVQNMSQMLIKNNRLDHLTINFLSEGSPLLFRTIDVGGAGLGASFLVISGNVGTIDTRTAISGGAAFTTVGMLQVRSVGSFVLADNSVKDAIGSVAIWPMLSSVNSDIAGSASNGVERFATRCNHHNGKEIVDYTGELVRSLSAAVITRNVSCTTCMLLAECNPLGTESLMQTTPQSGTRSTCGCRCFSIPSRPVAQDIANVSLFSTPMGQTCNICQRLRLKKPKTLTATPTLSATAVTPTAHGDSSTASRTSAPTLTPWQTPTVNHGSQSRTKTPKSSNPPSPGNRSIATRSQTAKLQNAVEASISPSAHVGSLPDVEFTNVKTATVRLPFESPKRLEDSTAAALSVVFSPKAAVAVAGTGTAAAAAASFASPAAAGSAVRVGMVAAVINCAFSDDDTAPSLFEHPVQVDLGSSILKSYLGSMVLTTCIFILFPSLLLVAFYAFGASKPTVSKGMALVQYRVVSTGCAIGLSYFAAVVFKSAVLVALHSGDSISAIIAVVCAIIALIPVVGLTFAIARRFHANITVESSPEGKPELHPREGNGMVLESLRAFVDGSKEPTRLVMRVYFVEEVFVTILLGILDGIRPINGACSTIAGSMLAVCLLHMCYLGVFRPYRSKLELLFVSLTGLLLLLLSALALVVTLSESTTSILEKVIAYVALAENIIFFLQAAVLAVWAYTVAERRRVRQRMEIKDNTQPLLRTPSQKSSDGDDVGGAQLVELEMSFISQDPIAPSNPLQAN